MRKTVITLLLAAATLSSFAQSGYDGLLFSENNYEGTARSVAMGNAFTALGGDLGSITINPAGSAVAGYSQVTITPGITLSTSTAHGVLPPPEYSTLPYFKNSMESRMSKASLPNLGFTLDWNTGRSSGLKNITFGFVANRTASFDQDVYARGLNSSTSFMGSMAFHATDRYMWADDLDLNVNKNAYDDFPWEYIVGYNSNMIAVYDGDQDGDFFAGASELILDNGEIALGGELEQTYGRRVSGGKQDYVINVGTNLSDFLYLGANLGISTLDYDYDEYFMEEAVDPADFPIILDNGDSFYFKKMKHNYWYNAEGSGVYMKVGAILTPGAGLRLGVAFQTPTTNTITERWQYVGSTTFSSQGQNGYEASPEGNYTYTFSSPYRANFGLAYTLGKFAVLSADWEISDYSQMKFESQGYDQDYYDELNNEIKEIFTTSHMLRLGAEVKLGALALRGGYGLTTSPEKNFEGSYRSNFSFGLGYSTKGSFFADFAVRKNIYNTEYYMPYSDYIFGYDEEGNEYVAEPVPELSIMRSDWKILLTLGWRI